MDEGFATISAIEDYTPDGSAVFPEGDYGQLPFAERRCLAKLMRNNYIWSEDPNHADDWATLVANADTIRGRLNDLFLDLVLDVDRGIAYKVQVRAGDHPILLRDSAYSREATILLIFLRQRYDSERRAGANQVFVDRDECRDHVAVFRPETSTDQAGDRNKVDTAIKILADGNILRRTSGDDDRFVVSPIIESILPVDKLHALLGWLIEQNSPSAAAFSAETDLEDEEAAE